MNDDRLACVGLIVKEQNMSETKNVIVETYGAVGQIRLNRPKAINALTPEMIGQIEAALNRFEADPEIGLVLITGEGERGLCAGGDIRALYDHRQENPEWGEVFFRAEYRMNAHIAMYKKPYVALMDGITMGGGVGVSAHGSVRIVTERTRMAMPETGIGFFPDIGASWLLSHGPGEVGSFMGLTGESFGGADAIYAGFADFFIQSKNIPALITGLTTLNKTVKITEIKERISIFCEEAAAPLAQHRKMIDHCFAHDQVEDIINALKAQKDEFAQKTIEVISQKSPTSLKLTLRLLRLARGDKTLQQSLEREFAVTRGILMSHDFYEGVRAAVVDKDRHPKWSPAALTDVSEALVDQYLAYKAEKLF